MTWTIVRSSAFMETWLELIGDPLVEKGSTRIFGSGRNPINFVAVQDVAAAVEHAALDETPTSHTVTVTGPENLTFDQFAETIRSGTGSKGKMGHIPRAAMRALSVLLRPFLPVITGQMRAAIAMDMGCHVSWNTAESTWDCPCHGSRFASNGRVLHGPALDPLETIELDSPSVPPPS